MRFTIGFGKYEVELAFSRQKWAHWTHSDRWNVRESKGFEGLLGFINFTYTKPGENIGDSLSRVLRQWPEKPKKDEQEKK